MNWRPLVICPDTALRQQLRGAMADMQGAEFTDYPTLLMALEASKKHRCNVCLVEAESQPERALSAIKDFVSVSLPVVVVLSQEDGPAILRALRAGASDFLAPPFDAASVEAAFERLAERTAAPEAQNTSRIWAVMPGKGSCGSTTLAVNLAFRLAAVGMGRVLLADLDLLTGSVDFHLNLKATFTAVDALGEWAQMDEEMWSRLVVAQRGVDVLLAPEEPHLAAPDARRMQALAELWRKRYRATLLDCALPSSPVSMAAARVADQTLVVTTNEIASLHATRRTLHFLERNGVAPERVQVVVSRYLPRVGLDRTTLEKALRKPIYAVLPNDFVGVQQRLLEGDLMKEQSEFGRSVSALARRMAGVERKGPKSSESGVAKIFGKFLKRPEPRSI
jgi:pilus assembly protein CpaE